MSAGYDAEVADLFRDLRAASNLTEADLAARISTPVEVVQALEQGAIYALPPWPETCRVVSAYGTLLNLDTRPLLRRIYAQLEAGVVELGPKPVQDVPVMVPPAGPAPAPSRAQPSAQPAPQGQPLPQDQPLRQDQPAPRPQASGWPNGSLQPQPAPQASPRPPAPQPQSPYPQAPQPQAPGWPNGPVGMPAPVSQRPAPQAQAGPSHAPQPQAPRPQAHQPQAPQPQAPQPQVPQSQAPQNQVSQPQAPLPPQPQPPGPQAPQAHPGERQSAPPSPGAWQRTAAEPSRAEPSPFDTAWPGAGPVAQPGPQPQPAQPQADAGFPDAGFPDADFGDDSGDAQFHPEYQGYAPDPSAMPDAGMSGAGMSGAGMADAGMPSEDASFPGDAALELEPELAEEPKKNFLKSPLLKWGIIGLVAVGVLLGLWMFLGGSSGDSGLSSGFDTSDPVLDPDDPRSRKADRLPNNF